MEAPEKIWINPSLDLPKLNGVLDKDSVEYICKDAFIEKACEWLLKNESYAKPTEVLVRDFKQAMEE